MAILRIQTAGESHGPAMICIVDGLPAGVSVDLDFINGELVRRQGGYGRGARQRIESDRVEILSGVIRGTTTGSPVALVVTNKDSRIDDPARTPPVHRPRPGHADLAGSLKYLTNDCRAVLERASARETAARVAGGALTRLLLRALGIEIFGFVRSIGPDPAATASLAVTQENFRQLVTARDASETYCPEPAATAAQVLAIHAAKVDKDTIGGWIETHIFGLPPGLGTCMSWDEKLDARLAFAAMSIQAIKAVEIGLGGECARRRGAEVHDPITFDQGERDQRHLGFTRARNNAGGIEGGMSNGAPVVVRAAMKPISTLLQGLPSIDLRTREPQASQYERSDICAVAAASVVLENVIAFEAARALLLKTGGDTLTEVRANQDQFLDAARAIS